MNDEFFAFVGGFSKSLEKYNKIHNVTRLKDIKAAALDSIKILEFADFTSGSKIADIGSGAGFPAIFLAFVKKDCEFYLFEPNYKKAAFLSLIKSEFALKNVTICAKKVEDEQDLKVDYITSRAFAKTDKIVTLCENISKIDTEFILYKGSFVNEELKNLNDYQIIEKKERKFLLFSKKSFNFVSL